MYFTFLYLSYVMMLLFFSTFISKLLKPISHITIIKEYSILPSSLIRPFFYFILLSESLICVTQIFGYTLFGAYIGIILLTLYSIAIFANLLKKNDLNCGCGGFLGEQKLTWKLIYRNLFFILIFISLIFFKYYFHLFLPFFFTSLGITSIPFLLSLCTLLFVNIFIQMNKIKEILISIIIKIKGGEL